MLCTGTNANRRGLCQADANAEPAADASVLDHDGPPQGVERKSFSRKWASVPTGLAGHADKGQASLGVDDRDAHPYVATICKRLQCADGTSGDAFHPLTPQAQIARLFFGIDMRRAPCDAVASTGGMQHLRRAGLDALGAANTASQKTLLISRAGRP